MIIHQQARKVNVFDLLISSLPNIINMPQLRLHYIITYTCKMIFKKTAERTNKQTIKQKQECMHT